jgi:osmotically-inducible protein OsmY
MLRCSDLTIDTSAEDRSHREIELAMQLEQRLQARMLRSIRVHISETELQLFGEVSCWHEKQQAQETAREVAPSYRIRNELRISPHHERRNSR